MRRLTIALGTAVLVVGLCLRADATVYSPLAWRWYGLDADGQTVARSGFSSTIWAVAPGTRLRLRMTHNFGGRRQGQRMTLFARDLQFSTGWAEVGADMVRWDAQAGLHGMAVPEAVLLAGSAPGVYIESRGYEPATVSGDLESEYALVLDRETYRPQARLRLAPGLWLDDAAPSISSYGRGAELCTTAGAPILNDVQAQHWTVSNFDMSGVAEVGDFDLDGELDLLFAEGTVGGKGMRLWRGLGNLTFERGVWISFDGARAMPGNYVTVCSGDWNADGAIDIVGYDSGNDDLEVMLGDGDLSFAGAQTFVHLSGTTTVAWCALDDWDGDGDVDVLLARNRSVGTDDTQWLPNTGTPSAPVYSSEVILQVDGSPMPYTYGRATVFDWDGDGLDDLVLHSGAQLLVYRNIGSNSAPALSAPLTTTLDYGDIEGTASVQPGLVDWNGDSFIDLLGANASFGALSWMGTSAVLPPSFDAPPMMGQSSLLSFVSPARATMFRLPNYDPTAVMGDHVLIADGNGAIWSLLSYSGGSTNSYDRVPAAFVDREQLTFSDTTAIVMPVPVIATGVDWNLDGGYDLLVGTGTGEVLLMLNESTSTAPLFAAPVALNTISGVIAVAGDASPVLGDFDRDGDADLVVGAADGSVTLFVNSASEAAPQWEDGVALLDGSGAPMVISGSAAPALNDWNDDGHLDIIHGSLTGQVYWRRNLAPALPWGFADAEALVVAGGPLIIGGPSNAVVVDWFHDDCARDLMAVDGTGGLWLVDGKAPGLVAPSAIAPVASTALMGDGSALLSNPPVMTWLAGVESTGETFAYEIELAQRSDFESVDVISTATGLAPPRALALAAPLEENRRYFWRLNSRNRLNNISPYSQHESFIVAGPFSAPVGGAPVAGRDGAPRAGAVVDGDVGAAAARDFGIADLLDRDTRLLLSEIHDGQGERLRWFFEIPAAHLVGRLHPELVVIGDVFDEWGGAADEALWLEVFEGGTRYRRLGPVPVGGGSARFPIVSGDFDGDRVFLRVVDDGADSVPTLLSLDWCAIETRNAVPVADAGFDRLAAPGVQVLLDARDSSDADGDPLTYLWARQTGSGAQPFDANGAVATFVVPPAPSGATIDLLLTVSDGDDSDTDVVRITVDAAPPTRGALLALESSSTVSAAEVKGPVGKQPLLALRASVLGTTNLTVDALRPHLMTDGSADMSIDGVDVVFDRNLNGEMDADEPVIAHGAVDSTGRLVFADLAVPMASGETVDLLFVADVSLSVKPVTAASSDLPLSLAGGLLLAAIGLGSMLLLRIRLTWMWATVLILGMGCIRDGFGAPSVDIWLVFGDGQSVQARADDTELDVVISGLPIVGPHLRIREP